MESKTHDELSVMLNQEEYDDISMAESLINDSQQDTESVTQVTVLLRSFVCCDACSIKQLSIYCVHEMSSPLRFLTLL